jgi:hypothetical protein
VTATNAVVLTALAVVTVRGFTVGKWLHKAGGALMLTTFAMLMLLPWLNLAHRSLREFHPLQTAVPVMSLMTLNIAAKMGFGALGGFEYVAIHAGECRNPERTIARSVALAAPIIAVMFILGTSSVLALVPIDRIDLIAPIPQVLSEGFGALGSAAAVAPITIAVLLCIRDRAGQRAVRGQHATADGRRVGRAAAGMVHPAAPALSHAGQLDSRSSAPVTLAFSIAGLVGVGQAGGFSAACGTQRGFSTRSRIW